MTEEDLTRIRAGTHFVCHGRWPRFDEVLERFGVAVMNRTPLPAALPLDTAVEAVAVFSNGMILTINDSVLMKHYDDSPRRHPFGSLRPFNEHVSNRRTVLMDQSRCIIPDEAVQCVVRAAHWDLISLGELADCIITPPCIRLFEHSFAYDMHIRGYVDEQHTANRSCLDLRGGGAAAASLDFLHSEIEFCDRLLPILSAVIFPSDGRCYRYDSAGVFGLHCVFGANSPKNAAKRK